LRETSGQDSRCPGQGSERTPSESKSEALPVFASFLDQTMLSGSPVITAWHVLKLWMEETFYRYGAVILKLCAANIMKVYFENEKNPICIEIYS
jgi:hypothetical protein